MTLANSIFLNTISLGGDDGQPAKLIQILKAGEFKHPSTGRVVKITSEDLAELKRNFDAKARGIDLAINYDHRQSTAHGTKAAGWIKTLVIKGERGDELWAEPKWTTTASKEIEDEEFKYFSAEIAFEYEDNMSGKKHGKVLLGGALTNYPVVKGMEAIAASETSLTSALEGKPMNLAELKVKAADLGIDLGGLQDKAKKLDTVTAELSEARTKLDVVEGRAKEAEGKVAALSEEIATAKKAAEAAKFDALVKQGMTDGKLTKAFAEGSFKNAFEKLGYDYCVSMLSEMPKAVHTEAAGHGGEANKTNKSASQELSELAGALAAKEKIDFSDAVSRVMAEKPELAKAYEAEFAE